MNIAYADNLFGGYQLFLEKEFLVSLGWTVVGSSDGDAIYAVNGHTAALAPGDQGSGGAYDAWKTGTPRTTATPVVPGDAGNAFAWCWLRNNGRDLLIVHTSSTSAAYRWYGRRFITRRGASFDGSVATATVFPGPPADPTDERLLSGTRTVGVSGEGYLRYWSMGDGYLNLIGDDAPTDDGDIGFLSIMMNQSTGATLSIFACIPFVDMLDPALETVTWQAGAGHYFDSGMWVYYDTTLGIWRNGVLPYDNVTFLTISSTQGLDTDGDIICLTPLAGVTGPSMPIGRWDDRFVIRKGYNGGGAGVSSRVRLPDLREYIGLGTSSITLLARWESGTASLAGAAAAVVQDGKLYRPTEELAFPVTIVDDRTAIEVFTTLGTVVTDTLTNRVWDTAAGGFVSWETAEPDALGLSYPGPGTFGADTSDFIVERQP